MVRRFLTIAVGVLALAACGSDSPAIDEGAAAGLQMQVQAIRDSAESSDPDGVEQGLADLRASVAQLREEGEIDGDRAAEILAAAADVEGRIADVPTTTTTTTLPEDDDDDDEGGGDD